MKKQTFKQGDKVHYRWSELSDKYDNGIVKEIVDEDNTRVVYHCAGEWDKYMDYTSALTANSQLRMGWIINDIPNCNHGVDGM